MSNRTLTRSRLSLLVAAALFGASGMAAAQSSDPAEIPVDDVSVRANIDEDGLDYNDGNVDEEDDESAIADAQDPENDDLDVDGDFDPEVDPDIGAHGGATGSSDDMAMEADADMDLDEDVDVVVDTDPVAVDTDPVAGADLDVDVDTDPLAADAELEVDADPLAVDADTEVDTMATDPATASVDPQDEAAMDAMGFESDSEVAASGDLGTQTTMGADAASDTSEGVEAGPPADAFAATAGTEGFSEGSTAASAEQRFNDLDGDSSGSLSSEEVAEVQPLQSSFEEYDINGDGSIAENEFQSFFAAEADVESDVQTAQVGDGTMDASDRAMEQDATAASTEPATDTAVASESTGMDGEDMDATAATDTEASTDATAATDDTATTTDATAATDTAASTEATAATTEDTADVEATAATDGSMDYDAYDDSSSLVQEPEEEDLTAQSDEDDQ